MGAQWIGRAFNLLTRIERGARPVTGVIFVLAGLYLSLKLDTAAGPSIVIALAGLFFGVAAPALALRGR